MTQRTSINELMMKIEYVWMENQELSSIGTNVEDWCVNVSDVMVEITQVKREERPGGQSGTRAYCHRAERRRLKDTVKCWQIR